MCDEHIVGTPRRSTGPRGGHNIASLPMHMGGLGLRRALKMAPAACWASWADVLHMIHQRVAQFEDGRPTSGNVRSRAG